jgi:hypothetical protein
VVGAPVNDLFSPDYFLESRGKQAFPFFLAIWFEI